MDRPLPTLSRAADALARHHQVIAKEFHERAGGCRGPHPAGEGGLSVHLIKGESLGATPIYRYRLPPGSHVVVAVLPDGRRQKKTVQVVPDAAVKLILKW